MLFLHHSTIIKIIKKIKIKKTGGREGLARNKAWGVLGGSLKKKTIDQNSHTGRVPSTAAVFPAGLPQQLFVLGNLGNLFLKHLSRSISHTYKLQVVILLLFYLLYRVQAD